jgi:hypothetical protein
MPLLVVSLLPHPALLPVKVPQSYNAPHKQNLSSEHCPNTVNTSYNALQQLPTGYTHAGCFCSTHKGSLKLEIAPGTCHPAQANLPKKVQQVQLHKCLSNLHPSQDNTVQLLPESPKCMVLVCRTSRDAYQLAKKHKKPNSKLTSVSRLLLSCTHVTVPNKPSPADPHAQTAATSLDQM